MGYLRVWIVAALALAKVLLCLILTCVNHPYKEGYTDYKLL